MEYSVESKLNLFKENGESYIGESFLWLKNNLKKIESNIDLLKKSMDTPLLFALYIEYLLLKKNLLLSANYMIQMENKYKNNPYVNLMKGKFYYETNDYEKAFQTFLSSINQTNSNIYFLLLILKCCKKANWHDRGVYLYEQAIQNPKLNINFKIMIMDYGAYFYHYNFNFNQSINVKKELIKLILFNIENSVYTKRNEIYSTKLALKSLLDITTLFNKQGLTSFLTSGTLLGWHRQKSLLKFDKDIDIGLWTDSDIRLANYIIKKNPRYNIESYQHYYSSYLTILDLETSCTIDILQFWENGNTIECGWLLQGKQKKESRILSFSKFELSKKIWNSQPINIPNNSDLFLKELYGNWKIPDPDFFGVMPNNLLKYTSFVASVAYSNIIINLKQKKFKKVHAIINKLIKYEEDDEDFNTLKVYIKQKITNV